MVRKIDVKVVVFGYNRRQKLLHLISKLLPQLKDLPFTVYIDGPRNKMDRDIQERILGDLNHLDNVDIVYREENYGLYKNIKTALDLELARHDWVIVLEDDLKIRDDFISETLAAIEFSNGLENIFSVCAFTEYRDRYFVQRRSKYTLRARFSCWGFAISSTVWQQINWRPIIQRSASEQLKAFLMCFWLAPDMVTLYFAVLNSKVSSWAFYAALTQAQYNLWSLHINSSLIDNIGIGDRATHTQAYTFIPPTEIDGTNSESCAHRERFRLVSWALCGCEILFRRIKK